MDKDDGGAAFPGLQYTTGHGCARVVIGPAGEVVWEQHSPGMTLRDYFAAKEEGPANEASPQFVADCLGIELPAEESDNRTWFLWWRRACALWKYAAADAMLDARKP